MEHRSPEEQFLFLITKGSEHLQNFLADSIPQSGRIQPFRIRFHIPGTRNIGLFIIESAESGSADDRYLQIGVFRENTDRLTSHYLTRGTNAALIEYLKTDELAEKLKSDFSHLSDKTDEYWD